MKKITPTLSLSQVKPNQKPSIPTSTPSKKKRHPFPHHTPIYNDNNKNPL